MTAADEISAIVLEVGQHVTKAGYAGEDSPRAHFNTATGILKTDSNAMDVDGDSTVQNKYFFAENAYSFREGMEIQHPLKDGLIENWDLYEQIVQYSFKDRLGINSNEHPLFICEPSFNTLDQRLKIAELAFEKFQCPALYFGRSGVLSAFQAGKSSGLVVDIGAGTSVVSPVYDGYLVKKNVKFEPLAGNALTAEALALLETKLHVNMTPQFKILRRKVVESGKPAEITLKKLQNVTKSYEVFMKKRLAADFKETVCAASDFRFDEAALSSLPQKSYEFPSGYNGNFGVDRFRIPELLFNPKLGSTSQLPGGLVGIPQLIKNAVDACDIDVKPVLLSNIILTGGSSAFLNMADRLNNELYSLFPTSKIRIYAASSTAERRFGSWIGGSIVSSLGTFQQSWISKQEFEEHGGSILEKRCA